MRTIKVLLISFYFGSANFSVVYGFQRLTKYRLNDVFETENETLYLTITLLLIMYGLIGITAFLVVSFKGFRTSSIKAK